MISEKIRNIMPAKMQEMTYIGGLPTNRDDCIALIESGGSPHICFGRDVISRPLLQLVIRTRTYEVGETLVRINKTALQAYSDADYDMTLVSEPLYFGQDEQHRHMWQLTFKIIIKEII